MARKHFLYWRLKGEWNWSASRYLQINWRTMKKFHVDVAVGRLQRVRVKRSEKLEARSENPWKYVIKGVWNARDLLTLIKLLKCAFYNTCLN